MNKSNNKSINKSNNNDINNDNNNNNGEGKKDKKEKKNRLTAPASKIKKAMSKSFKGAIKGLKEQALTKAEFFKTKDKGLISAEDYKDELIEKEKMKKAQKIQAAKDGVIYSESGEVIYPTIELDAFLNARRKVKKEEFRKLQEKEGFYFSKGLEDKELRQMKLDEGLHFIGTNIRALLDLFNINVDNGKKSKVGDVVSSGRSYELIGEHVDMEDQYEKILKDKMGYRLSDDKSLMPELELDEYSTFEEIVEESIQYTPTQKNKFSPKALYNMVKILDKYKKTEAQWLRIATAVDIIYRYMSVSLTREEFFNSEVEMDLDGVKELDEFFKTDHIFMTVQELKKYKDELKFYKYNPSKNNF